MQFDDKAPKLGYSGPGAPSRVMGIVAKAVTVIGGAILLMSALALSILFFAVVLVIGVLIGGYLWWKTREIRRQIRTQFPSDQPSPGEIIEGEIIEGEIIEGEIVEDDARRTQHERRIDP